MDIIQQIARKMVEEICSAIENIGLTDIGKTVKALQPIVAGTVLDIVGACIDQMDTALVAGAKALRRNDGITVKERNVPRTILTELGELTYRRTYFQKKDGTFLYLLDHMIGVTEYERISRELIADILQATAVSSYQQAIDTTKQEISRQTVHNRLVALDDLTADVERVKDTPEVLDLFADEDHAHLTPKGSAIVPLVTITEGMDTSDPKRHRTIQPLHIGAYGMEQAAFNENVLAVLTERYDLEKVKQINVHADGGKWIQGLQELLPNSRPVMDGYHLEKYLKAFLRLEGAQPYAAAIRKAMTKEDGYEAFERYCSSIYDKQTTERGREKVSKFTGYCASHWDAIVLRMQKKVCGSCTEAMISHVLSERLSRNPIAWSKNGLSKMTMLVVYQKNGGRVHGNNIRIRAGKQAKADFFENGYAKYRDYAQKQADEVLKAKHDWSLFERDCSLPGKVDGVYLIRKSFGATKPLLDLVS